ncbi:thiamine-phosphate kinase [Polymorphobacter fuscus]|uniref:Thiamine-monophosphate kinase n=1 Tax=Sandarakinorhabdus fusca TaxID=1439888 RepID=A0A7C9GNY9_9SPHN|nr:thiamine-phosphate kinase [Polymorphobacter fuscus]KAB7647814.1 thiamine-phosphate kinase [Polymorphobacter fuscus]MQT17115.1 thiamine-phosphate kinase [Polymorphobacter fuscus]NJC08893.1 thiamine-monophosphate kinase [Polymorphobacter fuscus]
MPERDFIARHLVPLATAPAARGLADDAAVWAPPLGRDLVFTHDVLACGIHYLAGDPPSDIAWKLLAVNLSDLAAMGATPAGVLLGLGMSAAEDAAWRETFTRGLGRALAAFDVALWGGDTVSGLDRAVLGLTAIGHVAPGGALSRRGACIGDAIWVSGTIGDAGIGLTMARGTIPAAKPLLDRFRRPMPRLALGQALVGVATACMDVSDGLLIDADRLGRASRARLDIDVAAVPVADGPWTTGLDDRLARVTAGDDYELLFTTPADADVPALAARARTPVTRIGTVVAGAGVRALCDGRDVTPDRLGWEHG